MISIGDIISLIEKGKNIRDFYTKMQKKKIDKFVLREKAGRHRTHLYEFLAELYYDLDILTGPDGPFPVGILNIKDAARETPDTLLGHLLQRSEEIKVKEPRILEALKRRGANIWNGKTFSLESLTLDLEGNVNKINASIGSYFNMVSSADYLEFEAFAAIESLDANIALDDLPARQKALSLERTPSECLRHGGGVDSAIAISTLVVYLREGRYWLLCEVRSKKVAVHSDLYHVLPSLMFQPVTGSSEASLKTEWSITHNIYREYLEELFSVPEVRSIKKEIAPDFFYKQPNLLYLQNLIRAGTAQLRGIAVAFNLLNHRPEICTLLLINDESWYTDQKDIFNARSLGLRHLNINEEFLRIDADEDKTHPELVTTLPLDHEHWGEIVKPSLMVPPGAAALVLGAREATSILRLPEPEWLQKITVQRSRH
ncbi:MAG: hypothetical protein IPP13_21820 [Kouleothrix sp.]|jgi:hypothetical protein|nr:hypothetical protein [Kouleothrix sp.]